MLTHKHTSISVSNLQAHKQQMRETPVTSAREQIIYLHARIFNFTLVFGEPCVVLHMRSFDFVFALLMDKIIGTFCLSVKPVCKGSKCCHAVPRWAD